MLFIGSSLHSIYFAFLLLTIFHSIQILQDDNLKFVLAYDEALSHLLFAGSDIILCQSFSDPTDETPVSPSPSPLVVIFLH